MMYKQITISLSAKESNSSEPWLPKAGGGMPEKGSREISINLDAAGNSRQEIVKELAHKIAINAFMCALSALDDGFNEKTIVEDIKEIHKFL